MAPPAKSRKRPTSVYHFPECYCRYTPPNASDCRTTSCYLTDRSGPAPQRHKRLARRWRIKNSSSGAFLRIITKEITPELTQLVVIFFNSGPYTHYPYIIY